MASGERRILRKMLLGKQENDKFKNSAVEHDKRHETTMEIPLLLYHSQPRHSSSLYGLLLLLFLPLLFHHPDHDDSFSVVASPSQSQSCENALDSGPSIFFYEQPGAIVVQEWLL